MTAAHTPPAPAKQSAGIAARALALVLAALLGMLSAVIVLPSVTMGLLLASVAAAEYSPLLAIADLLAMLAVARLLRGHRTLRRAALVVLALAVAVALWPLARFHRVARDAGRQLGLTGDVALYSPLDAFRAPLAQGEAHERRITYRSADGSPLEMRLYQGIRSGARPTVVVLYGGAWRSGDASQGADVNRALAAHGFTVAAIDYRHAPAARFPAQLEDVRRSLALLHDSAAAWRIDTAHVALLGRSSGGHLAELAAWSPGGAPVQAVVAIYAPFDLVQGYEDLPTPDPIDVRAVLRAFVGGTPDDRRAAYHDASPSSFVRAGLPPTLLLYGGRDHVVKPAFNRSAATLLRAVRVPVVQVEIPWGEHGFDMAPGGLGAQLSMAVVTAFLDRSLGNVH